MRHFTLRYSEKSFNKKPKASAKKLILGGVHCIWRSAFFDYTAIDFALRETSANCKLQQRIQIIGWQENMTRWSEGVGWKAGVIFIYQNSIPRSALLWSLRVVDPRKSMFIDFFRSYKRLQSWNDWSNNFDVPHTFFNCRDKVEKCKQLVSECSGILAIGTSLQTFSGYRLFLQAKDQGKQIGILNIGDTRADHLAHLKIKVQAGKILPRINVSNIARWHQNWENLKLCHFRKHNLVNTLLLPNIKCCSTNHGQYEYWTQSKLNKCILFYYGVDIINLYSRYIYGYEYMKTWL